MNLSGSGKTTLLNVLNNYSCGNLTVEGQIMINGVIKNPRKMALLSCYIQQEDLFFGTMTVREHLEFHVSELEIYTPQQIFNLFFSLNLCKAMLRMEKNITNERKRQRVAEVLKEVNFNKYKNFDSLKMFKHDN